MIHPSVSFEELRSTRNTHEATSGNVLENQSLYWHPSFYKESGDGTKEIVEPDWTTIYYAFQKGKTIAFPEGFRMISFMPNGLELTCYNYGGNNTSSYDKEGKNENNFEGMHFPSEPCEELAASFTFPTCWDGTNLGTEDHASHVTYGIGLENGKLETFGYGNIQCPESHPILLPQILLFLRFVNYTGEFYELSNGDGSDWHADYIMGWEEEFLQDIMDRCDDLKDIPCGSTRLREIRGTGAKSKDKSGKNRSNSWSVMGEELRKVRVPMVNTTCITNEPITKVESVPRGSCEGSILSLDSCNQPELPDEFLIDGRSIESESSSTVIPPAFALIFSVMLVAVFFTGF